METKLFFFVPETEASYAAKDEYRQKKNRPMQWGNTREKRNDKQRFFKSYIVIQAYCQPRMTIS